MLAGLCGRAFRPADDELTSVDPERMALLARRHRVQGLVHPALASRGVEVLAGDARTIALDVLRSAAASRELRDRFAQAGIPLLFLKGLPVGKLAYGDPTPKMSADLDVLVRPADLLRAAHLLQEAGFVPILPPSRDRLPAWHRRFKESVWQRDGAPLLELHTALTDNPALLNGLQPFTATREVQVLPGLVLPTLAPTEQFAYLAVHGASSAWFRLKWLCDFAALVPRDAASLEALTERSLTLGAGRAVACALLLSRRLFGTVLPGQLLPDRATRILTRLALRQLQAVREPTRRPLGTLGIHGSQLLLRAGPRFALVEALRQAGDLLARRRLA